MAGGRGHRPRKRFLKNDENPFSTVLGKPDSLSFAAFKFTDGFSTGPATQGNDDTALVVFKETGGAAATRARRGLRRERCVKRYRAKVVRESWCHRQ